MATINPLMRPIDYTVDVQSPFESALGGFKLGAGIAEIQAAQQSREAAKTAQTELANLFKNPNATATDYARVTAFLPKDQAATVLSGFEAQTKEQQQNTLRQGTQVYTAIKSGNLPVAEMQLKEQATALRNAGREKEAQGFDDLSNLIRLNPTGAQTTIALTIAGLPGGKEFLESADKTLSTQRAEALQPSALKEAIAKADEAVAKAISAQAKAKTAPEVEAANALKAKADADKAAVEAKYAERVAIDAIIKRGADLGLTKAQTNKVVVETKNLNETGKMLKLDYEAAVKGVPLPSKNTGTNVGNATEDERKAAGWLSQATNAYTNMLNAMYTKEGKRTGAEVVGTGELALGKLAQSPERQNFVQAASSLSEALLRAATGAGVNKDEALQKLEELTPTYFDTEENVKQKLAAIPVYLDSLKARAGRAAPADFAIPTKESVIEAKPFSITVGGKTFYLPTQEALDIFKNSDAYKKAAGIK